MLENVCGCTILPMTVRERDGEKSYIYNIGKGRCLADLTDQGISADMAFKVLNTLKDYRKDCGNYFLDPCGMILEPRKIFEDENGIKFLYKPGQKSEIKEEIRKLCTFFFKNADYSNGELLDILQKAMMDLSKEDFSLEMLGCSGEEKEEQRQQLKAGSRESDVYHNTFLYLPDNADEEPEGAEESAVKISERIQDNYVKERSQKFLKGIRGRIGTVFKKEREDDFWDPEEADEIIFHNGIPSFVKENPDIHIVLRNTEDRREVHEVASFPASIGKTPGEADVVIKDSFVDKRHALMEYDGGIVSLRDLGSVYGTYVNGKKIKKNAAVEIRDGDKVGFAGMSYEAGFIRA